ncbi:MAG: hypothetical protein OXR67_15100 [Chloroflexota bacterium]|nr:hypothetical protein [Chloroflexota bacterium]
MVDRTSRPSQEWDLLVRTAWRVVGAVESPQNRPDLPRLIDGVLRRVSQQYSIHSTMCDQPRETLYGWFQVRDGRPALAGDASSEVDEFVLLGAAERLIEGKPEPANDTLFWAIGTLHVEEAAEKILASWSPEQIDTLLDYSVGVLQNLSEKESVINPERILGSTAQGGNVSVDPAYRLDRVRIFRRTDFGRPDLYRGVANVIFLVMTLRPGRFPELVEMVDHPVIQRWALFVVSRHSVADRWQILDWLKENQSEPVTAIAIVHALEVVRELAGEASHPGREQKERDEASTVAVELLSDLVTQLAQYELGDSVRWLAQLYEHGELPRVLVDESGGYDLGERLEDLCIEKLEELVREDWNDKLREAFRSSIRQGVGIHRSLPLGTIALNLSPDHPSRAVEIATIVLENHEEQTGEIIRTNERAFYTLTDRRTIKWIRGLGASLALALPEDESPLNWVTSECSRLQLSVWEAEDNPERFRVADDLAQMQMAIALYAVVVQYETGTSIEAETVRNLADCAWKHTCFVAKQEGFLLEEPEVDELAARVVVGLGNPSEEWLILQANRLDIGIRGLWGLVDSYVKEFGHPTLLKELSNTIAARYRYSRGVEISALRYLAKIWQTMEASGPALETAQAMLDFHQRAMKREDYCVALKLLVLASREKGSSSRTRLEMMSLYEHLWGSHVPREEVDLKQSVDAVLA